MKTIVTMIINDGKPSETDISAYSNECASIHITAQNMQEALKLLTDAEKKAQKAAKAWKPVEKKPEQKQKTYKDYAAEYEATEEGQRFIKEIKNARKVGTTYGNGGLRMSQVDYLMCKHNNILLEGLSDIYALGYRSGFNKGKKVSKA